MKIVNIWKFLEFMSINGKCPYPRAKMNGKCPTPRAQKTGKTPTLSRGGPSGIHLILPLRTILNFSFFAICGYKLALETPYKYTHTGVVSIKIEIWLQSKLANRSELLV